MHLVTSSTVRGLILILLYRGTVSGASVCQQTDITTNEPMKRTTPGNMKPTTAGGLASLKPRDEDPCGGNSQPLISGSKYNVPVSSLSASSTYVPNSGDLSVAKSRFGPCSNNYCSWSANLNSQDDEPYIQVDLGEEFYVLSVSTLGRPHDHAPSEQWVTEYTMLFSMDGSDFLEEDNDGQFFIGNEQSDVAARNEMPCAIRARYVRLKVLAWQTHPSLRWELFGCPADPLPTTTEVDDMMTSQEMMSTTKKSQDQITTTTATSTTSNTATTTTNTATTTTNTATTTTSNTATTTTGAATTTTSNTATTTTSNAATTTMSNMATTTTANLATTTTTIAAASTTTSNAAASTTTASNSAGSTSSSHVGGTILSSSITPQAFETTTSGTPRVTLPSTHISLLLLGLSYVLILSSRI